MSTDSPKTPTGAEKTCRCASKVSIFIWSIVLLIIVAALLVRFTQGGQRIWGDILNKGFTTWLMGEGSSESEKQAAAILESKDVIVIKEQQGITSVSFGNCPNPNDETLKQIAKLDHLLTANLTGTDITDDQLAYLSKLSNLNTVVINGTRIGDDGVAHLVNLPALQSLQASNTKITDKGVEHIAKLPSLTILDLSYTGVTDKGMKSVASLKNINWLLVRGDNITDQGIIELAAIPELKHLTLSKEMKVSTEAIGKLKSALPKLVVDFENTVTPEKKPANAAPPADEAGK